MRSLDVRDALVRHLFWENERQDRGAQAHQAKEGGYGIQPLFNGKNFSWDLWRGTSSFKIAEQSVKERICPEKDPIDLSLSTPEQRTSLVNWFLESLFQTHPTAEISPEEKRVYSGLIQCIGDQEFFSLSVRMITYLFSKTYDREDHAQQDDFAYIPKEYPGKRHLNFSFTKQGFLRMECHFTLRPHDFSGEEDGCVHVRILHEFSIRPSYPDLSAAQGWLVVCKVLTATIEYPESHRAVFKAAFKTEGGILEMLKRILFRILACLGLYHGPSLFFRSEAGNVIDAILSESEFPKRVLRQGEIARILSRYEAGSSELGLCTDARTALNEVKSNSARELSSLGVVTDPVWEGVGVALEAALGNSPSQPDLTAYARDPLAAGDDQDTAVGRLTLSTAGVRTQLNSRLFHPTVKPPSWAAPIPDESEVEQSALKGLVRSC